MVEEGRVLYQTRHLGTVTLAAPAAARKCLLHLATLEIVLVAVLVHLVRDRGWGEG